MKPITAAFHFAKEGGDKGLAEMLRRAVDDRNGPALHTALVHISQKAQHPNAREAANAALVQIT
jgi:hypothetical protein